MRRAWQANRLVGTIAMETGLLVSAGDARALEQALGSLVSDETLRMNLGRRGQSIVLPLSCHGEGLQRCVWGWPVVCAVSVGDAAAGSSVLR